MQHRSIERTRTSRSIDAAWRAAWIGCGVLLATAFAAEPLRAQEPDVEVAHARRSADEINTVLLSVTRAGESAIDRAALKLAGGGTRTIPALFDALVARPGPTELDATKVQNESLERRVLKQALCHVPMPVLYGLFQEKTGSGASAEQRTAVLDVLADCGSVVDLALIVKVANESSRDGVVPDIVRAAMQRTVTRVLLRDPRGFSILEGLFPDLPVELQADLLEAVTRTESDLALKFLARSFEHARSLRLLALNLMGRISSNVSRPVDELVLAEVRGRVIERDDDVLPEATLLCGQLDDFDAAPHLVELLLDSRRSVSANAAWALRRMTGLRFADDHERWTTWLETESKWWRTEASDVLRRLASSDVVEVKRALLIISLQHSFRHHLAEDVVPLLTHPDAGVVELACRTLGRLASTAGVAGLVECLDRPEPTVKTSACASLKAITRLDFSCESEAWRAIVKPRAYERSPGSEIPSASQSRGL